MPQAKTAWPTGPVLRFSPSLENLQYSRNTRNWLREILPAVRTFRRVLQSEISGRAYTLGPPVRVPPGDEPMSLLCAPFAHFGNHKPYFALQNEQICKEKRDRCQ
jgi:hypothetical protein